MCKYCETHNCWICTTSRGSSQCLHCEQHDAFTFKWTFCPWCGEKYKILNNGHEYLRVKRLDIDECKTYLSETAPDHRRLIRVDNCGGWEYDYIK